MKGASEMEHHEASMGVSEGVSEDIKVASKWYHRSIKRASKGNPEASREHQGGIMRESKEHQGQGRVQEIQTRGELVP